MASARSSEIPDSTMFRTFKNPRSYNQVLPSVGYVALHNPTCTSRALLCNVVLTLTYQLHGQEITEGFMHYKPDGKLHVLTPPHRSYALLPAAGLQLSGFRKDTQYCCISFLYRRPFHQPPHFLAQMACLLTVYTDFTFYPELGHS